MGESSFFGAAIRKIRMELGLQQKAVARASNLSLRHYRRIEAGQSFLSLGSALKVCEAMKIAPSELFFEVAEEFLKHEQREFGIF